MSSTDRVRRWQARTATKSAYFEELDKIRRRSLDLQFAQTKCQPGDEDIVEHVRRFFLAYPRCFNAPAEIINPLDGHYGCRFEQTISVWEHTAGAVALLDLYDDIVTGEVRDHRVGAAATQIIPIEQQWIDETREEVDLLKRLGLWDPDKRFRPAMSVVKGAR